MFSKKTAKVLAFALSLSCVASAIAPMTASAAGSEHGVFTARTKEEKYGDDTYANRFMSLYADVIEEGVENGYLSPQDGKEIPYHCVETLNVEAPDYGHETTSEAMSYLVWIASMRDHIVNQGLTTADNAPTSSNELATAWSNMETMIPTEQSGFWEKSKAGALSAQYTDEYDEPEDCPVAAETSNTGTNPLQKIFANTYSSDNGLYLLHWLADVNDWYGFGGSTAGVEDGSFTFINTFQRGEHESCWETVPFGCVEELKYGNSQQGIKGGLFNTDSSTAPQYAYTNAPDAEDRAIQGVHNAIRWGNADSTVVTLAGKMGDELRNNFFDKYYKKISVSTTKNDSSEQVYDSSPSSGYQSAHYLRNWYTSWGGALDGSWAWQIGCSHAHEFYQNPLAAYALLADPDLNSAMKADGATKDYQTSLSRQLEFYLWLQSEDGPIAGGATNSLHGRYEDYSSGYDYTPDRGSSKHITSEFYGMIYLEHPVYEDPGSNHWIGNQVWALQRISELYYDVSVNGDKSDGVTAGGLSIEDACAKIMDRWVQWSLDNIKFDDEAISTIESYGGTVANTDYAWAIPSSLIWDGQPDSWTGDGTHDNTNLTCEIEGYGQEVGSTASWANGLIYYAAAKGVDTNTTKTADELIASSDNAEKALGYAKKMLDYQWASCRDDIGLTMVDTNSNLTRFFEEEVYVPSNYHGTMPNGDAIESGATFFSLRSMYANDPDYERLKAAYDAGDVTQATWTYHRFWHEGDALMANGVMASLFPKLTPAESSSVTDDDLVKEDSIEVEVGESKKLTVADGVTLTIDDDSIATVSDDGTVTGKSAGTTTVTVSKDGQSETVTVTVTETSTSTTTSATTTSSTTTTSSATTTTSSSNTTTTSSSSDRLWGDANCDSQVKNNDVQLIRQYLLHMDVEISDDGLLNSDVTHDDSIKNNDVQLIRQYLLHIVEYDALCP